MPARGPILITGGHRSGTGWVGEMLAATPSPSLAYIWEPFSLRARRGIRDVDLRHWFTLVTEANEAGIRAAIEDVLAFRYHPASELLRIGSPKDAGRMLRDWTRTARWRRRDAVPLLKDPIALFSAGWLADTFSMDVVVLIRHPAAFVNSLMRKGWDHPFSHFTEQPELMAQLEPYRHELERFAAHEQPLFDQAVLLWLVIHERIRTYEERRPWTFLRHEDVSREPVTRFRALYDTLGLTWTDGVRATIEAHSGAGNPGDTDDPAAHRRESAAVITSWKRHLSPDEIRTIRARTEQLAARWYGDDDWA
jgi:hypothetical protein